MKGLLDDSHSQGVPILDDAGKSVGLLRPVDRELAEESEVVASLAKWRQRWRRHFLTWFHATPERTRSWLKNVVLQEDSRILFLIMDETGRAIGNYGVCNITRDSAELDNLIRGEHGGHPRLIYFSEVGLVHWLYSELGVNSVYCHVFSNNARTLRHHEVVGFVRGRVFKLVRQEAEGEVHYEVHHDAEPGEDELGLVRMALDRDAFLLQHPLPRQP